jgi:hypothetical protein
MLIGSSIFLHIDLFMVNEAYPRVVPFYAISRWDSPPKLESGGLDALDKPRTMMRMYLDVKRNKMDSVDLKFIESIYPTYKWTGGDPGQQLDKWFQNINLEVLSEKYIYLSQ